MTDMTSNAGGRALESVWDYPRPPRVEPSDRRVRVIVDGAGPDETKIVGEVSFPSTTSTATSLSDVAVFS